MPSDPAPSRSTAQPLLSIVDASKSFGSTHALRGVTLDFSPGEVHALVGENGAGKSTLIKIITGLYRPDAGTVCVDGEAVEMKGAADAQALGIACIYQEPLVFPDLSVSENIFMNSAGGGRFVRWRDMHRRAGEILRRLEVDIDPRALASQLTVGAQQAVEIAKAMSRDVRVLIMDEPTAALSAHEVRRLFRQVRGLTEAGVAVLFVSHRLDGMPIDVHARPRPAQRLPVILRGHQHACTSERIDCLARLCRHLHPQRTRLRASRWLTHCAALQWRR